MGAPSNVGAAAVTTTARSALSSRATGRTPKAVLRLVGGWDHLVDLVRGGRSSQFCRVALPEHDPDTCHAPDPRHVCPTCRSNQKKVFAAKAPTSPEPNDVVAIGARLGPLFGAELVIPALIRWPTWFDLCNRRPSLRRLRRRLPPPHVGPALVGARRSRPPLRRRLHRRRQRPRARPQGPLLHPSARPRCHGPHRHLPSRHRRTGSDGHLRPPPRAGSHQPMTIDNQRPRFSRSRNQRPTEWG